jgi:hypothetical protein
VGPVFPLPPINVSTYFLLATSSSFSGIFADTGGFKNAAVPRTLKLLLTTAS